MSDPSRFPVEGLLPGDCLLYFPSDLFGWAVALKTWTPVCHAEGYIGGGISVASRNGVGVDRYPLRVEGACCVRRPFGGFDINKANGWFAGCARGQGYDWLGLLCFTLAVRHGSPRKMFCSEFMTRYYRSGDLVPFDPDWDADHTPPAFFLASPAFWTFWRHPRLRLGRRPLPLKP